MKLSIIVPVFKVEAYLDFCLQSLLEQGLNDYEVVLVDDCSPDSCGQMCDDWARRDPRFKTVHCKRNGGLSSARNVGIKVATGDYITFVDSDDFLAPDTLGINMSILEGNPEISVLEYPVYVSYGSKKAYEYIPGSGNVVKYKDWISSCGYMYSYACNKIYKRNLWEQHEFPQGKLMEDLFTTPYVIKDAGQIMRTNKGLYYYCDRKGSISNTITKKNAEDYLEAYMKLYKELMSEKYIADSVLDDLYLRLCNAQIILLQIGETREIPYRNIPLKSSVSIRRSITMNIKGLLQWLLGDNYCEVVAKVRNFNKRLV